MVFIGRNGIEEEEMQDAGQHEDNTNAHEFALGPWGEGGREKGKPIKAAAKRRVPAMGPKVRQRRGPKRIGEQDRPRGRCRAQSDEYATCESGRDDHIERRFHGDDEGEHTLSRKTQCWVTRDWMSKFAIKCVASSECFEEVDEEILDDK